MCSCSDKIAAWNIVGVQGSLLATKLIEPIFIQSITIGRKFAYRHSAGILLSRFKNVSERQSPGADAMREEIRFGSHRYGFRRRV